MIKVEALVLSAAVLLAVPGAVLAQSTREGAAADDALNKLPVVIEKYGQSASSAYCGLYCFYANAKSYGRDVDLSKLISLKYMTGAFGSSVKDLLTCSRDFGFRAESFSALSMLDLWLMERPVLVLVKNTLDGKLYNHWVLVLRVEYGEVRLLDPSSFDPSTGLTTLPTSEFLSIWSGIGCVVIPEQADFAVHKIGRWVSIALKVIALFGLALLYCCCRLCVRGRFKWLLVPIFAIGLALPYHCCTSIGFMKNASHVTMLTTPPRKDVEYTTVETWMADPELRQRCLLIDVRYPNAFRLRHIAGAVSIPITSSDLKFLASLRNVTRDTPIVLYCQSSQCPWAAAAARRRLFDPFSHVTVLEGGMQAHREFLDAHKDGSVNKGGS